MNRAEIIANIEAAAPDQDLTILRKARFRKRPLKTLCFYSLITFNRYTPFLLKIKGLTVWGDQFSSYASSAIGAIYYQGFYDSEITLFLLKYFDESGDLLDIGANIGYYSSLFTQIAAPNAKIFAFEPTPSTFSLLQKNVGGLANVQCEKIAIADQNGTATFHDYGYRHGVFNSIAAQPIDFLQNTGSKIEVQTETLDSWCERKEVRPSLIKLDTEGTEASILEYAGGTLEKHQPVILLEVGGGEAWSTNNNKSLDILAGHDYEFFTVGEHGDLSPHTRQRSYQYTNLVAIHSSKVARYVANH